MAAKRIHVLQQKFLDTLRQGCSVALACKAAGVERKIAYEWRKQDKEFASQWDFAVEEGTDRLEDALFQKALAMSDSISLRAAMFILKARRPEKYCDKTPKDIAREDGVWVSHADMAQARKRLYAKLRNIRVRSPKKETLSSLDVTPGTWSQK